MSDTFSGLNVWLTLSLNSAELIGHISNSCLCLLIPQGLLTPCCDIHLGQHELWLQEVSNLTCDWLVAGHQPIRSHVRISLFTNMKFYMNLSELASPSSSMHSMSAILYSNNPCTCMGWHLYSQLQVGYKLEAAWRDTVGHLTAANACKALLNLTKHWCICEDSFYAT